MTNPIKITSLYQLKKWNKNPTKKLPIILDWFMPYFFEKLLTKEKFELAKDAFDTMVRTTEICEKFTTEEAHRRTFFNLCYYCGYSAAWFISLEKFFKMYNINSKYIKST